ncbi:MAG: hypothetical protein LAO31_10140 [Acidobacteriia bacterium]|nr:hypothetical protein [Terriglobia bacterium]
MTGSKYVVAPKWRLERPDPIHTRPHSYCGLTLKELGEAAGGLRLTTVSEAVRRFQRQMQKNGDLAARFALAVSTLWNA